MHRSCGGGCHINNVKYDHCLAKRANPKCKLQFSIQILAVVVFCNAAKSALMIFTLWRHLDETLLTFGDAIASWLNQPDESTKGRCLADRSNLKWTLPDRSLDLKDFLYARNNHEATALHTRSLQRWRAAVSNIRWRTAILLCFAVIVTASALLIRIGVELGDAWQLGSVKDFGAVKPSSILNTNLPTEGSAGLISVLLIVNSPQLIVSSCYLLYNGLFTSMHLAHEYSGYARQRKPLRVTTPKGMQRSTYWLQLPYVYGMPLIISSAILHWLVSQSIFLARIVTFVDEEGSGGEFEDKILNKGAAGSQIGFSVGAILAAIVLATCMLLTVIGMGYRKLESDMPVAASCSFALAAATHRPKEDVDASVLPVMWGEVPEMGSEEVGHCCFTSHDVVALIPGRKYAGTRRD